MQKKIIIVALILSAQPALACQIPAGWQEMATEVSTDLTVAAKIPAQPIKTGARFSIDVMVCGETMKAAKVEMDATMPAHKHGMNYIPEVKKLSPEQFQATGMFFHMPGQWQVTVDLKDENTQRFYLDVTAQ
ncbi:MAG: FixH family protein [Pseudomonadota bacterium]